MNVALRLVVMCIIAVLLLSVIPGLEFRTDRLHPAPVVILNGIILILSLSLFRFIEWWAERITGYQVSLSRRIFIPVPVLLCIATIAHLVILPYHSRGDVDGYANATLIAAVALPFTLIEDKGAPVRFIFGVWTAHVVWFYAALLTVLNLRAMSAPFMSSN